MFDIIVIISFCLLIALIVATQEAFVWIKKKLKKKRVNDTHFATFPLSETKQDGDGYWIRIREGLSLYHCLTKKEGENLKLYVPDLDFRLCLYKKKRKGIELLMNVPAGKLERFQ